MILFMFHTHGDILTAYDKRKLHFSLLLSRMVGRFKYGEAFAIRYMPSTDVLPNLDIYKKTQSLCSLEGMFCCDIISPRCFLHTVLVEIRMQ